MHRWRYPSLSLHGIEGAFSEAGAKTVIPHKVNGKFSIRLVPDMDPKVVEKQVYLNPPNGCVALTTLYELLCELYIYNNTKGVLMEKCLPVPFPKITLLV